MGSGSPWIGIHSVFPPTLPHPNDDRRGMNAGVPIFSGIELAVGVRVAPSTQGADGPIDFLGVENFGLKPWKFLQSLTKAQIMKGQSKEYQQSTTETAAQGLSLSLLESRLFVF